MRLLSEAENDRLLENYTSHFTDPPFLIRKHESAPLFKNVDEGQRVLQELIVEITSGSRMASYSEEVRRYLRQAGFVNLWFFLKFIAGFNGPYEKLNDQLHMDMCNFRMSDHCMTGGSRAFSFMPRSAYKSTIFSHGANSWEVVLNPDIRIRIVNAIIDRAYDFKRVTQRTFDSNPLFAWLYPEYVPEPSASRWNEKEMVVPNRTRYFKEPTIKVGGATGSSEGDHHDMLNLDDLIGLDDLSSDLGSNALMEQKKKWFRTSTKALLDSWTTSRIVGVATRYAVDDVYSIPINSLKHLIGYQHEEMKEKNTGVWSVYYRKVEEDGQIIFPEMYTREGLAELRDDPDSYWTYITQYVNDPQASGMAEFYEFKPGIVDVFFDVRENDYVIDFDGDEINKKAPFTVKLGDLDVVMSIDPAATDKGISSKTSRSSIGIWAGDHKGRVFRIWEKVGFMSIYEIFDAIFEGHERYPGYIRTTVVEANAFQKVIEPLLMREQESRNLYISPHGIPASGDKDARIRSALGIKLAKGNLFLARGYSHNFIDEMRVFPMSEYKKDVLDESEKGITAISEPMSPGEVAHREYEDVQRDVVVDNVLGY